MSFDYPDPLEHEELHAEDLHVAELLGLYISRREQHQPPRLHQLLTTAAGADARRKLRTVVAFYEAAQPTRR